MLKFFFSGFALGVLSLFAMTTALLNLPASDIATQVRSADGYSFKGKAFTKSPARVYTRYYKDVLELRAEYKKRFPDSDATTVLAFSEWNEYSCEVNIIDPSISYQPEIAGHEFYHCVHGHFHG